MIGIINSGIGNIASIKSALNKKSIEHKVCISKNDFDKINKIILPGVGSFKTFYENLIENSIFEILKKKFKMECQFLEYVLVIMLFLKALMSLDIMKA